ncbi:hypothetical protein E2C01_027031 [Portunus trituberculatus]|uniref:Uncharacterized protein n=1 Tax=Portunus trituberculatus TaxID=210409 RepID=A0A5B7EKV5_PORTR|nr:hypothetical protein [Portunus trituberculatus]
MPQGKRKQRESRTAVREKRRRAFIPSTTVYLHTEYVHVHILVLWVSAGEVERAQWASCLECLERGHVAQCGVSGGSRCPRAGLCQGHCCPHSLSDLLYPMRPNTSVGGGEGGNGVVYVWLNNEAKSGVWRAAYLEILHEVMALLMTWVTKIPCDRIERLRSSRHDLTDTCKQNRLTPKETCNQGTGHHTCTLNKICTRT